MSEISDLDSQIADLSASIETNGARKESLEVAKATIAEMWSHLDEITEEHMKMFMNEFVEDVQILEEPDVVNGQNLWIKSVKFKVLFRRGDDVGRDFDINHVLQPKLETDETVCLLSKGDVKSKKIRVEFSLEDMDTDGFKKGATYNAIRDWIKEKYGYMVTNLNIAQVKQKHGIIERENYNKPKSPDSKQPGCPEEKVKAIEDAMRHFQMI